MSKILSATCEAGVVKVDDLTIPGVTVMSEGVAASEGVLLIEVAELHYFGKTSGDLKLALEKIASALSQIATALTTLDAKPVGGTGSAPAPAAASAISQISSLQAELTTLKGNLR